MAPLLVYICSCLTFHDIPFEDSIIIKLLFDHTEDIAQIYLRNRISSFADLFQNPSNVIDENSHPTKSYGFSTCFYEPFHSLILLQTGDPYGEEEEDVKRMKKK